MHYIAGQAVHRASESYRGEGRTDARDAAVIADQARNGRDLQRLRTDDETVTDLKILTGRRTDLVTGRTRTVNRLRALLADIFPSLERVLDLTKTGPLILLTDYQPPASLRRTARNGSKPGLRNHKVLRADRLAETAREAAGRSK
ncbi:transposase [Streptomyces sp. SP17KL33]|nr:transposase [Streptomyces sp. SP17KL33]MEE1829384.1 transposase [Streptomyces sp. SP17KL33]